MEWASIGTKNVLLKDKFEQVGRKIHWRPKAILKKGHPRKVVFKHQKHDLIESRERERRKFIFGVVSPSIFFAFVANLILGKGSTHPFFLYFDRIDRGSGFKSWTKQLTTTTYYVPNECIMTHLGVKIETKKFETTRRLKILRLWNTSRIFMSVQWPQIETQKYRILIHGDGFYYSIEIKVQELNGYSASCCFI